MGMNPERMAEAVAQAIQMATAPLAARIAVLEARPMGGVEWAGTFQDGTVYDVGQLATRGGSLWLCVRKTAATPGSDASAPYWRLVVKERR